MKTKQHTLSEFFNIVKSKLGKNETSFTILDCLPKIKKKDLDLKKYEIKMGGAFAWKKN
jgi:hypothetical protein